jgi:hypothetical protein
VVKKSGWYAALFFPVADAYFFYRSLQRRRLLQNVINAFANGAEAEQPDNQFMFHASLEVYNTAAVAAVDNNGKLFQTVIQKR